MKSTNEILLQAKASVGVMAGLSAKKKNEALAAMADALEANAADILEANADDIAAVRDTMNQVMIDRLLLTENRIRGMARGIRDVIELPDPVGEVLETLERPNGLTIQKVRVPMGVVAIIYESRPNVTSDAAALSLKSGNVCVLRGGKEAFRSSCAVISAMRKGLAAVSLPVTLINLVEDTTRESAKELMTAAGLVDLLIPRGGKGLISACVANAKVPCIETGTGICHVYVDDAADLDKAAEIVYNAKTSRPSVCNAEEALLVHEAVADTFLPLLKRKLVDERKENGLTPVELRLDERAAAIIEGTPAAEADFDTEFLDYILAVKVVKNIEQAVSHIALHSTHHSDAIVTENPQHAEVFVSTVDSAAVYVNASTRFTDGGEFGLGCEIGISTQKLHARGPMGLKELTTYKYVVRGDGQVR